MCNHVFLYRGWLRIAVQIHSADYDREEHEGKEMRKLVQSIETQPVVLIVPQCHPVFIGVPLPGWHHLVPLPSFETAPFPSPERRSGMEQNRPSIHLY